MSARKFRLTVKNIARRFSHKGQKLKHSFRAPDEELRAQRITKAVIACYFVISAIIVGAVYLQGTPALSESQIVGTHRSPTGTVFDGEATQIGEVAFLLRECAKRDLEMLIEIELEANDHVVTPTEISNATFKLLDARMACRDGRFAEAFMTYDEVLRRLSPLPPVANHRTSASRSADPKGVP